MPTKVNSYRNTLKATSLVGVGAGLTMLISLIRVKIFAVLLGATGVGVLGLYNSIINTASTFLGFGLAGSAIRELAAHNADLRSAFIVRRSLWYGSLCLGLIATMVLYLLREPIASYIFNVHDAGAKIGWIGAGVFFTIIATSQSAILRGIRKLKEMVQANILGALFGSVCAVAIIWKMGTEGIIWFVIVGPMASYIANAYFVRRVIGPEQYALDIINMMGPLRAMVKLGAAFTIAEIITQLTQLLVRVIINRKYGLEATGYYQAAWSISMTYLGFVLTAMAADYYPRLVSVINEKEKSNAMVNEQAEIALLLSAPLILGMLTLTHWVVTALYHRGFGPTEEILQWQLFGDLIKVITWPMGFIIVARGAWKLYIFAQALWNISYIAIIIITVSYIGLKATGISYLASYALLFVVNDVITKRINGFRYDNSIVAMTGCLLLVATMMALSKLLSNNIGLIISMTITAIVTLGSIYRFKKIW